MCDQNQFEKDRQEYEARGLVTEKLWPEHQVRLRISGWCRTQITNLKSWLPACQCLDGQP
jgi:hypothetical protein